MSVIITSRNYATHPHLAIAVEQLLHVAGARNKIGIEPIRTIYPNKEIALTALYDRMCPNEVHIEEYVP